MRLLLIRHGQTPSNVRGLLDSAPPGPGLTDLGLAQAAALPGALQDRAVSSITVSTLIRTHQTAAPLSTQRGLTLLVEDGIREIPAGVLEKRGDREAFEIYTNAAWGWSEGALERRIPGSEDGHEFFRRFDDVVDRTMARGEELPVIVSHGGCIRAWVGGRAQNAGPGFAAESDLHNTGWAELCRDASGEWALVEWHAGPMGGADLEGVSGPDPTGASVGEVDGRAR